MADIAIVPGRTCGSCTLCCKLPRIDSTSSPADTWCRHCTPGRGCRIYETRPDECRSFLCDWMTTKLLGEEWKPSVAKMIVTGGGTNYRMQVQVDPGTPDAWRREPYYSQLKAYARAALAAGTHVIVYLKGRTIAILPDRDVDLGVVPAGHQLRFRQVPAPQGWRYDVEVIPGAAPADQRSSFA